MQNLFTIREANEEDAQRIIHYMNQVGGESDNLTFGKDGCPLSLQEEREYIINIHESPNSLLLIGEINGEAAALATVKGNGRQRIAHRAGVGISVLKKYWRQGLASAMMDRMIAFCKEADITVIELEVRADNEGAVKLYEKAGFEKVGIHKRFFRINGQYYDAYLMNLYL